MVGDALGVPVEFKDRECTRANPVTGMRVYGTHHQPPGTWSDNSSLLLWTVESLPNEWIAALARKGDLDCLFHEFFLTLEGQ